MSGAAGSPFGAGMSWTICSRSSRTPVPTLPDVRTAWRAGIPMTSSICSRAISGTADGRSTLLMHGTIVRSLWIARYAFASVCASTPCVASTTRTAPSHAASERDTS